MIVTDYLMGQNPLYKFRGTISILIALIVVAYSHKLNITKNRYINQLILPICIYFVSMVLLDMVARIMISSDQKDKLRIKCKQWINDPNTANNPKNILPTNELLINMDEVYNYDGKIDGFDIVNNGKEQVKERFEIIDPNMPNVNKGTDIQQDDNNNNINLDNTQAYKYLRDINSNRQIYSATPVGQNIDKYSLKKRLNEAFTDKCLLGNGCGYLCSGSDENKCNVVAPIPGPQWQPQTAAAVQNRLNNGNYVPPICNQGGKILRRAEDCKNLPDGLNCDDIQVTCKTVPILNQ